MRSLRYDTLWGWTAVLLAGLAWCVLPLRASAQGLDVRATAAPVNTLSFTDVDFLNATTPRWLFTIDIDAHGRTIIAVMTVTLKAELALGQTYDPAVELKTRQFRVQATRTITNLDIGRGKTIVDTSYIVDPGAKAAFKEKALPGGTMPAGIYTFNVRVDEVGGEGATGTAPQPPTIVLSNPSSVELLFPFDGDRSVNQFPLFQWLFDGPRSTIAIFEKLPNQESLEEAASGVPQVTKDFLANQASFQYPSAGVRMLEPGHTYVWFVEGHVATAGGSDLLYRSALRSFAVAEAGAAFTSSLLDDIERALDPKYKPLFDQIRAEKVLPSGDMRLNGSPLSLPDLARILARLRSNPGSVTSVGIE